MIKKLTNIRISVSQNTEKKEDGYTTTVYISWKNGQKSLAIPITALVSPIVGLWMASGLLGKMVFVGLLLCVLVVMIVLDDWVGVGQLFEMMMDLLRP